MDEEEAVQYEDERMEEEMRTEMLRNAAEGLCIALREPARILAHTPASAAECARALPLARWLRDAGADEGHEPPPPHCPLPLVAAAGRGRL